LLAISIASPINMLYAMLVLGAMISIVDLLIKAKDYVPLRQT
jgi:hypothetical protein